MPYDLFVTTAPAPPPGQLDDSSMLWQYWGTYTTRWHADVDRDTAPHKQPDLKRWRLFKARSTSAAKATLWAEGAY